MVPGLAQESKLQFDVVIAYYGRRVFLIPTIATPAYSSFHILYWNENVVVLTKFPSLTTPKVVILTTSSEAGDENVIKMTFPFQCISNMCGITHSLQWRHSGSDGVSNHQTRDCFLNRLFRRRSKKTSKLRVTGLCAGNSPETGEFPAQRASNAENVSIWWRHHVFHVGCNHPHSNTAVKATAWLRNYVLRFYMDVFTDKYHKPHRSG